MPDQTETVVDRPTPVAPSDEDIFDALDANALWWRNARSGTTPIVAALGPVAVGLLATQVVFFHENSGRAKLLVGIEAFLIFVASLTWFPLFTVVHDRWVEYRLAAEQVWRERVLRRARVGPYLAGTDAEADSELASRCERLRALATTLKPSAAAIDALLGRMAPALDDGTPWRDDLEDHRETLVPAEAGFLEYYRDKRLLKQMRWYRRRSQHYLRYDSWMEWLVFALMVAALGMAGLHMHFLKTEGSPAASKFGQWVALLGLVLPPAAVLVLSLRTYYQTHRLGLSYEDQACGLEAAIDTLNRLEATNPENLDLQLKRMVLTMEETLTAENRRWALTLRPEHPKGGC